ncbi:MAG: 16S rRNA (guanine(527)-N(7))-methyltransferase RsmG [Alphaproteobacteria bacterium]|nr:16S rRNA (guanine(527)-N(7))-methyltransferase RsmG [Alphaproteobacteria bacterium]
MQQLEQFVAHLLYWQEHKNLIAKSTVAHIWGRHVLDSAQLYRLLPPELTFLDSRHALVDIGSGAGFPAIVLAILGIRRVIMVESQQSKARFLTEVKTKLNLDCAIHPVRLEQLSQDFCTPLTIRVFTARAVAPLTTLLSYCASRATPTTRGFFFKGRSWPEEIAEAKKNWKLNYRIHPSITEPESAIIEIMEFKKRS